MAKDGRTKRIPKRIGSVKIPKDVRRHGDRLIDALIAHAAGPAGRQVMFEAMGGITRIAMEAMATEFWPAGPFGRNRAESGSGQGAGPRRPPPPQSPIPPEPVTPPRPPVPPMPPAGATREPDFEAIAETIGATVETILQRIFPATRRKTDAEE